MKKLSLDYKKLKCIIINFILIIVISKTIYANEISFEIQGNNFTDRNVILALLKDIPETIDKQSSDKIIKVLSESNLFSQVSVKLVEDKYIIIVKENPIIDSIFYTNNERLKDEDLESIASTLDFKIFDKNSIDLFINELKKIYESFGYNNVSIDFTFDLKKQSNTVDLYFEINEGDITKINNIFITGNNFFQSQDIKEIINSKTKSITNIFANNNYKPAIVERDKYIISNFYKKSGFIDVTVQTQIEYLNTNKVNITFNISEGDIYNISSVQVVDDKNLLNENILNKINLQIDDFIVIEKTFSSEKILLLKDEITSTIIESGIDHFEINSFDKKENKKISVLFQLLPITPKYTNQINIVGNSRTFDSVIRRELTIVEGDAVYANQIDSLRKKLLSLNLFKTVKIKEEIIDNENINLIIEVEEKQTGTFNAGISLGTLDGFAIVSGLREENFYGTGRSVDLLVNTSENKNQFKLITTDRLSYENDADISYSINYKQQDFSRASSYKLNSFSTGIGVAYKLNENLFHKVDLEYLLKDYIVTNSSSVSNSIQTSSGANISYLIRNNLRFSTLDSRFTPKKGNYFDYINVLETPTSSNNGFLKNIITVKKYYNKNKNIFSIQSKFGNIISLNNNDILTDDKFSLGGRWLRGFDNFGVGPRNSRTSYVGGNNVAATKLDYSYEITNTSNFPIYINLFNDYGLIWDNKTKPTHNGNSLRSSAGFGIKYYSPIGPIGFTWGFPIIDEEYDIKRMFLFSVGNID